MCDFNHTAVGRIPGERLVPESESFEWPGGAGLARAECCEVEARGWELT